MVGEAECDADGRGRFGSPFAKDPPPCAKDPRRGSFAVGDRLRVVVGSEPFDCTFVSTDDQDAGTPPCASCRSARPGAFGPPAPVDCSLRVQISGAAPTTLTIEPFGGGAALASQTFTPHGVVVNACCGSTTYDAMSMTIP